MTLLVALLCAAAPHAPADAAREPPAAATFAEAARFADWLLERGDFYRAIGEYQRALFLDPGRDPSAIELRIARAYAGGGKPDAAVGVLRGILERGRDRAARDEALFEIGRVRYRAGAAAEAAAALEPYVAIEEPAGGPGPERARLLLSLSLLRAGDGNGARAVLDAFAPGSPHARDAGDLRAAIAEAERTPRKSPVLAGVLSAAVPGLGIAYAGNLGAGAAALALNGLFAWATVDAFRDRRYGLGALLLVGESIWYGGAIFGAVAEAMRHNRDARDAALRGIDERFKWVFAFEPGGATIGFRAAFGGASDRR